MTEKKKEEPVEKLEKEFKDFQKEWKEFLTNDFHHLVVNVDTLITQNNGIQQNMGTMSGDIRMLKNCVTAIDQGIIELLKREH